MVWLRWMDGCVVGGLGVGFIGVVEGALGMDAGWGWGYWGTFGIVRGVVRLLTVELDGMVWLWLWCCGCGLF